jgi:hypothetical protein
LKENTNQNTSEKMKDYTDTLRNDIVTEIMRFEEGELGIDETLGLFSSLIKSGIVWGLQGSYGRMARHLIDQGSLSEDGTITHEFLPF